ncbi:MAG: ribosome maturation factor RimP [Proteobacteria bacterium]|nr:MAG: ribosome maturation factor RimP [Pseudomonadota bacterium]QKK12214.1 MAG: ribosome maturation factor RimP [Pseudomonadota bacterium]
MRRAPDKLYQLLEPVIVGMGYELVGIEFAAGPRGGLLRIYIDRPEGIGVSDCQRVSYQISGVLDVEDPIPGNYNLEVSSPGLDRPLFDRTHYERFSGQRVKVRMAIPQEGRRKFEGLLQGLEGDSVVLVQDGETVKLPLAEIEQARLAPEF